MTRWGSRRWTLLAVLAAAALPACQSGPKVPPRVAAAPDPFVRLPYLQVTPAGEAQVRWRVQGDGAPLSFEYRVERDGSESDADVSWRSARVDEGEGGDRRALLDDLPAAHPVTYRVRAGTTSAGPHTFRTPPPDSSTAPVEVLAFGDSGWGSLAQVRLAGIMEERAWDLAVHVGDLAYDDGTERDFTVRHFRVYAPLLARVPLFPVPGNHDVRTGGGAAFDRAFGWTGASGRKRWGAFRWGHVQFVGLDTSSEGARERLEDRRGAQYEWLAATLEAAATDPGVGAIVLYTHYPMYSHAVGLSGHGPSEELREAIEPLLLEHGVDLVLAGHDHHYERTRPLRGGRPVADGCGPVHLIIGGGGASRFARAISRDARLAEISRDHHFLDLTVTTTGIEGTAIGVDGRPIDEFRVELYAPGDGTCPG